LPSLAFPTTSVATTDRFPEADDYAGYMDQSELSPRAGDWIKYWRAPTSAEREAYVDAADDYDLLRDEPETAWLLILEIHRQDQSMAIKQVLSAGLVEDLLALHGDAFIDRVETKAQQDPQFAKLLGGVWKFTMSDAVWTRLQAVWDRRGWDGTPE